MGFSGISRGVLAGAVSLVIFITISCGGGDAEAEAPMRLSEHERETERFEESREELEQQMVLQLRHEVLSSHIEKLRRDMDIEIFTEALESGDEDAPVARVNDAEVYLWELNYLIDQQIQQMALTGIDPKSTEGLQRIREIRPQLLERIISSAVLEQRAQEIGLTATDRQIELQYQMLAEEFGGADALEAELARSGLTAEELKVDIARQLPAQMYAEHYLETSIDPQDLEFTEAQLREFYDSRREP